MDGIVKVVMAVFIGRSVGGMWDNESGVLVGVGVAYMNKGMIFLLPVVGVGACDEREGEAVFVFAVLRVFAAEHSA